VGVRYVRQLNLIDVPIDAATVTDDTVPEIVKEFRARYERLVGEGTSNDETPVEVVRVTVSIASPAPDVVPTAPEHAAVADVGIRSAWFGGRLRDCPVHTWSQLKPGDEVRGPAFIESAQTTVVVYEGLTAVVDDLGNVHLIQESLP
jgi:N-methylhydantoinase A